MFWLVRWSALTVFAVFCAASIAGRLAGSERGRRFPEAPRLGVLHGAPGSSDPGRFRLADRATGEVSEVSIGEGEVLDMAAVAPWRDDRGRWQVAGRLQRHIGRGATRQLSAAGLARIEVPTGRLLDWREVSPLPSSPLAWLDGDSSRARVVYASADGGLHTFDFDAEEGAVSRRLRWEAPEIAEDRFQAFDLTVWSGAGTGTGWESALIVSASARGAGAEGAVRFSVPRLWVLRLDAEGTAVRSAAPLGEVSDSDSDWDRWPSAVSRGDGTGVLFWQRQTGTGGDAVELRVVELSRTGESGARVVAPRGASRSLARHRHAAGVATSLEGDWAMFPGAGGVAEARRWRRFEGGVLARPLLSLASPVARALAGWGVIGN